MTYEEPISQFSLHPWGICVEEADVKKAHRRKDDQLWKAVLEDLFEDFLHFFFPEDVQLFDLQRGVEFLDKEFDLLFPSDEQTTGVRHVDKLVKVYLKDGRESYFLTHIEVQGQKGKEDFAGRMFQYGYRVKDKYKVPVTALAILTDASKQFHPKAYMEEWLRTRFSYEFNVYKILDQQEAALRAHANPFALVVLATLLAMKNKKVGDQQLLQIKRELLREMLARNLDKDRQRGIFNFLNHFVHFENQETKHIFEQDVRQLTGRSITMGTEEYLLDKAMREGMEKGLEKGIEKGIKNGIKKGRVEEKEQIAKNLILQLGLTDQQAAGVAEVSVSFVRKLRRKLKQNDPASI